MSLAASLARLPKHAKLLKAADYNHVFDKPARSSDRYFTVLARPNTLLHARLGMAFSKKTGEAGSSKKSIKTYFSRKFSIDTIRTTIKKAAVIRPGNVASGLYCFSWRAMRKSDQ